MFIYISAKQLAEAVILWSIECGGNPVLCMEKEDADDLKHLDLFLSTMDAFKDGFDGKFEIAYDEHKRHFQFSKEKFISYLRPRCLLLAQTNGCFDLLMTCAFVSHAVLLLSTCNSCCHLSRVACKLLTAVLEERFTEMFTDSGWRNLMSYCRKIHDVVFPSRENRPEGHFLADFEDSEKKDDEPENKDKSDWEDANCNTELSGNRLLKAEPVDCSGGDLDAKLSAMTIKKEADNDCIGGDLDAKLSAMTIKKEADNDCNGGDLDAKLSAMTIKNEADNDCSGVDAKLTEMTISGEVAERNSNDSSDDESSDDESVYWEYEFMSNWTICKRVSDSRKHLSDVLDCLDMLKESMDAGNISSNKYDIPVSDDEDIMKLKKREVHSDNSEWTFKFSDRAVDTLRKEVCEKKNKELGNSSENQVLPENVTDEEIFKQFVILTSRPEDEPLCELCDDKINEFKTNWLESYAERYSNHELVSDVI